MNRWCALLIFGLLSTGIGGAFAAENPETVHVVFDLDDTLIRWVRPNEIAEGPILPINGDINGYRYRVLDGAPEIIASVLKIPGAKVSFFSIGEKGRNMKVLSELKLPDGRSALDVAHRVLSVEDASFERKVKKDLHKILSPGDRLDRVILVDDKMESALIGQDKNLLWIGEKPEFHRTHLSEKPDRGLEHFIQYRNKLARARGLIEEALELSRSMRIPLSEALYRVQWVKGTDRHPGHSFRHESLSDMRLYRQGLKAFREVNPEFRFTPAVPQKTPIGCIRSVLREQLSLDRK